MQKEANEERGKGRSRPLKEEWGEKEARRDRIKKGREKHMKGEENIKGGKIRRMCMLAERYSKTQKANSSAPVEMALRGSL
jgi:hypothetical protein